MDGPLIWAAIGALLLGLATWWAYRAGRARERARLAEKSAKSKKVKTDALETASATPAPTVRERLRAFARKRNLPD